MEIFNDRNDDVTEESDDMGSTYNKAVEAIAEIEKAFGREWLMIGLGMEQADLDKINSAKKLRSTSETENIITRVEGEDTWELSTTGQITKVPPLALAYGVKIGDIEIIE